MAMSSHNRQPSLTDSPFYWLVLFGTMALLGLAVVGPKFDARQQHLERRQQAREHDWRQRQGQNVPAAPRANSTGPAHIGSSVLWPLFIVIAVVVALAAARLIVQYAHAAGGGDAAPTPADVRFHAEPNHGIKH